MTTAQLQRLEALPDELTVIGEREGAPVVVRPDGRLVRVQSDGQLATETVVLSAQSYLSVEHC
jgi:hypothetical protein